ncbi:unnamed protein product, partial [Discosporangium mesarthrocarpum]
SVFPSTPRNPHRTSWSTFSWQHITQPWSSGASLQREGARTALSWRAKRPSRCSTTATSSPQTSASTRREKNAPEFGNDNLAFVLLNRYVDLTEAIEDGDPGALDNADFAEATNVPVIETLPTRQYVPNESEREEVRDWVLSVCMDASIEQALPPEGEVTGTLYQ